MSITTAFQEYKMFICEERENGNVLLVVAYLHIYLFIYISVSLQSIRVYNLSLVISLLCTYCDKVKWGFTDLQSHRRSPTPEVGQLNTI